MVCLGYAESENNPVIGTRQAGGSSHQRTLWSDFRQRSNPVCLAQGMARAIKATQTTFQGLASLPVTEVRGFTLGSVSVYCNVSTPSPLGDGQITPIILETHDLKGSND
jgi:hypothetical protein